MHITSNRPITPESPNRCSSNITHRIQTELTPPAAAGSSIRCYADETHTFQVQMTHPPNVISMLSNVISKHPEQGRSSNSCYVYGAQNIQQLLCQWGSEHPTAVMSMGLRTSNSCYVNGAQNIQQLLYLWGSEHPTAVMSMGLRTSNSCYV
jgi:hypothetical protein